MGEMRYRDEDVLPKSATEYFHQNCWMGVSQPGSEDAAALDQIGVDRFMWGSDYPHDEGTGPFSRETLRQRFHDVPEPKMRKVLAGNVAELYGFDLEALAPLADQRRADRVRDRRAAGRAARAPERGAAPPLTSSPPPPRICEARTHFPGHPRGLL